MQACGLWKKEKKTRFRKTWREQQIKIYDLDSTIV